jgi:hypothetical protein
MDPKVATPSLTPEFWALALGVAEAVEVATARVEVDELPKAERGGKGLLDGTGAVGFLGIVSTAPQN